jgi:hypothetical protein
MDLLVYRLACITNSSGAFCSLDEEKDRRMDHQVGVQRLREAVRWGGARPHVTTVTRMTTVTKPLSYIEHQRSARIGK